MKNIIALLATVLTSFSPLLSQSTMGSKLKLMPVDYLMPKGNIAVNDRFLSMQPQNLWVVFSESDRIHTYTAPGGTSAYKEINYMAPFFVLDQKDGWLKLAKWEPLLPNRDIDIKSGELKKELEYYGWIEEDRLLAWRHCLVDPSTYISIKMLPLKNANMAMTSTLQQNNIKYYKDPGLTLENTLHKTDYIFLYVFKRKGNASLIGQVSEIKTGESTNAITNILGWVPSAAITEWKTRLVLSPNQDVDAVAERKIKQIKACVFYDHETAKKFLNYPEANSANNREMILDNENYSNPTLSETKFLPLLSDDLLDIDNTPLKTIFCPPSSKNNPTELCNVGFSVYKPKGLNKPLLSLLAFMSEAELHYIIDNFTRINSANVAPAELRQKLQDGFKSIALTYYGAAQARKVIAEKNAADVVSMIKGIPTKNTILKKIKIDQISNSQHVSDTELIEIKKLFDNSLDALNNYAADDRNFIERNNTRLCFVPVTLFP